MCIRAAENAVERKVDVVVGHADRGATPDPVLDIAASAQAPHAVKRGGAASREKTVSAEAAARRATVRALPELIIALPRQNPWPPIPQPTVKHLPEQ